MDWQPIETAPHNKAVLLGWADWRDGRWVMEVGAATTGERFDNGYSSISQHGSATHWMPLPPPPQEQEEGSSRADLSPASRSQDQHSDGGEG